MKTKTMVIIGVVIAVLAVAYFVFFKGTATTPAVTGPVALGKKGSGTPYYQADIDKQVSDIRSSATWLADVQKKATAAGKSRAEQLKLDAIWMLENQN